MVKIDENFAEIILKFQNCYFTFYGYCMVALNGHKDVLNDYWVVTSGLNHRFSTKLTLNWVIFKISKMGAHP